MQSRRSWLALVLFAFVAMLGGGRPAAGAGGQATASAVAAPPSTGSLRSENDRARAPVEPVSSDEAAAGLAPSRFALAQLVGVALASSSRVPDAPQLSALRSSAQPRGPPSVM